MQNRNELSLEEMQQCEAKMLKYLHTICVGNNITYYLFYGTLLGAVRHQGFIPWDDDLDVAVPRKDYKKLLEILNSHNEYRVLTHEYFDDYYYPFAKLIDPKTRLVEFGVKDCKELGVWIDIFPLDSVSDNPLIRKIQTNTVAKLVGMNRYISAEEKSILQEANSFPKKLKYFVAKRFKHRTIINLIHMIAGMYANKKTEYKAELIWASDHNRFFQKELFGKPKMLPFEDGNYFVPIGYDSILRKTYGNYLELPPIEKRHSDHSYSCYKITE